MVYSYREQADMIFIYGRANGNGREAARLYLEVFPYRQQPQHSTFASIFQRLSETGSLISSFEGRGRQKEVRTVALEENILQHIDEDPNLSTREVGAMLRVGNSTVWRVLHEQLLHPYHIQRVQSLTPADYPARVNFCNWYVNQTANDMFSALVMYTDEATFMKDGIKNVHNNHVWADGNPHAIIEGNHQVRFKVNVWIGIIGDILLGPHFLPPTLTGNNYREFIENELPLLLEDVPLQLRNNCFFMHDGAPAHYTLRVRELLNNIYGQNWIGRGGAIPWPARSPDLNPIDFYVWGHLKSMVYSMPINDVETLRLRILQSCNTIRNNPGIFERVRQSMMRRVRSCIASNGGHFEHLL